MTARPTELAALPCVLRWESPASWLTRAALSQGVEMRALLEYLGIADDIDSDLAFLGEAFPRISALCGFDKGAFFEARHVMTSLLKVDRTGMRFLLRTDIGRPRYRICPRCALEESTPYLAFHCRFGAWRFCPEHHCMLEDACWACGAAIRLPANLAGAGPMQGKCAYLSQCSSCGKSHTRAPVVCLDASASFLTLFERMQLDNGRATLAALLERRVLLHGNERKPLSYLRRIERMGLLGTKARAPTADLLRERRAAREAANVSSVDQPGVALPVIRQSSQEIDCSGMSRSGPSRSS